MERKLSVFARLRYLGQSLFLKWSSKRLSENDRYTLHRKNLYIFPTMTGGAFIVLALVIWLLGTNYQNNLILALSYMQVSVFVITILNTYNNLSGVEVRFIGNANACVGETIGFEFSVTTPNKIGSHYVSVGWRSAYYKFGYVNGCDTELFDCDATEIKRLKVNTIGDKRGRFSPRYLLVKSTFPMGLLNCWTWLKFDAEAIVYPAPVECSLPLCSGGTDDEDGSTDSALSGSDFSGFSEYQPGMSLKHIAWTLYAKEQGLYCKQFSALESQQTWLNWSDFYNGDVELCLSNLCFWALKLSRSNQSFGVQLPSSVVDVGDGDNHLQSVLTALALYEDGSP